MRQLVYISTIRREIAGTIDPRAILVESRRNNARDGITGLLFFDGKRFLQALEGDEATVDATFRRIEGDRRHHGLVVLSIREIASREFGEWSMAYRSAGEGDPVALERISALTANAGPEIRATFDGFVRIRRAA